MWEIRTRDNELRITVNSLEYDGEWMGACAVTVNIESPCPVDFRLGDWLEYRGERFEINYDPSVIKSAPRYAKGDAFKYDGVKLNSLSEELTRCRFYDVAINDNDIHFTSLPKFSFYAPSVKELADRIQANLDRFSEQNGTEKWVVEVHPEYAEKTDVNVSADNLDIWGALKIAVNDFKAYFTIKGRKITIGTAGLPASHLFRYGKGEGLYEIERSGEDGQAIVTRLRAYGSTRNLPSRYYQRIGEDWRAMYALTSVSKESGSDSVVASLSWNGMETIDESALVGKSVAGSTVTGYFPVQVNGKVYRARYVNNGSKRLVYIGHRNTGAFASPEAGSDVLTADELSRMRAGDRIYYTACTGDVPENRREVLSDFIPNNLAVKNLMLPGFPDLSQDVYIDSPNIDKIGVLEGSVFFDGSDSDLPEIYPSIEEMTADMLRDAGFATVSEGCLDELVSAEQITDNGIGVINETEGTSTPPDGKKKFTIEIKDLGFDINDYLTTQTACVSFKNGKLGGREFEIACCEKTDAGYRLELNRVYDDDLELWFPYDRYNADAGDRFVLLYIDMPDVYIKVASQRLESAAREWLSKNDYARSIYTPRIDEIFMARQHDEAIASNGSVASLHDTIKEGMQLLFEDEDLGVSGAIVIDRLTIKEVESSVPTYEVTLKEEKTVGALERVQNKIDSLARGFGQGGGGYTAQQIQKFIRTYGARYFLSKIMNDSTPYDLGVGGMLRALGGAEFGEFMSGAFGAAVDSHGNSEVESIVVRSFMQVAELVVNRLAAIEGDAVLTESDIFEQVDEIAPDSAGNRRFRCRVHEQWDGYFSAQYRNNVLRGVYNDIVNRITPGTKGTTTINNATYYTSWTRVESIGGAENGNDPNVMTVTMYPDEEVPAGTNFPPCAMMRVARWGNAGGTEQELKRQTCLYLSSTEGRIMKHFRVTKPIIDKGNVAFSVGTVPEFLAAMSAKINVGDEVGYFHKLVVQNLITLDWQGRPQPTIRHRGEWDATVAASTVEIEGEPYPDGYFNGDTQREATQDFERSTVGHIGCVWICCKDNTMRPPLDGGLDWALYAGNPRITLQWAGSEDSVWADNPQLTLEVLASINYEDYTANPRMRWAWTRRSWHGDVEQTASDALWNSQHASGTNSITLGMADMNYSFGKPPTRLEYSVTATLMDSDGKPVVVKFDNGTSHVSEAGTPELMSARMTFEI